MVKTPKQGNKALDLMSGGPSTARGLNFQTKYAVFAALDAIQRYLISPALNPVIQVEARLGQTTSATQWDLFIVDENQLAEIKLNVQRQDILDFVSRVHTATTELHSDMEFNFVYASSRTALLDSLDRMRRVANESRGNVDEFDRLLRLRDIANAQQLLGMLGDAPVKLLERINLINFTEDALHELVQAKANALAGQDGESLSDLLFAKLSRATASRQSFSASELIDFVAARGISLMTPTQGIVPSAEQDLIDILGVLQTAPEGLPAEVLGQSVRQSQTEIEGNLGLLRDRNLICESAGRWGVVPSFRGNVALRNDISVAALHAVLAWIRERRHLTISRSDIKCALTLAKTVSGHRPEDVARSFITLDKPVKRLGDKHLVLDAANLAIDSAKVSRPRSKEVIEGEAQAYICGRSWVYQRINRLDDAKAAAAISRRLGEDISWQRNTAFCEKCVGRLCRLEAEREQNASRKAELLGESVQHLNSAVRSFAEMDEMSEVGDCYSLLGRTYLAAGNLQEAFKAAEAADDMLTNPESKDYLDLLILQGDLAAARKSFSTAEEKYSLVIKVNSTGDFEKSEIRARAHFQRARVYVEQDKVALARKDFSTAAAMWHDLGEAEMEALSQWNELRLSGKLPDEAIAAVREERPAVRVRAVKMHLETLAQTQTKGAPKRIKSPGKAYWTEVIKRARQQAAADSPEW